ncbi:bacterial Ig-like domain-containing protein [Enterococcus faecalis]|uniref:bacterial Ig-like domain-containing protein n=1 Tax=Enterococcus faecalis TaxID=1351 RepID=UPI003CC5C158
MKKKFMLLLYILIFQIFSINQEQIAFAEIANVPTEEKINNSFNETEISPSISGFESGIQAIKPYEINIGDKFDMSYPFISARSPDGKIINYEDIEKSWVFGQPVIPDEVGSRGILKYHYEMDGYEVTKLIDVEVVARDGRRAEIKDIKLYVGQKWDLGSIFLNVRDRDGNPMKPEQVNDVWINGDRRKEINTSKPGKHLIKIGVSSPRTKPLVFSNVAIVTVKEDETKAEIKDTKLYVGQKWDLGSVFKNVVDKDGNPIKPEQVEWVWVDGQEKVREIDTSKPGKHTVQIAVPNAHNQWVNSNTATVTVKEDKTKAILKDAELYVGQKWDLGSVLESVVDKDGNPIKLEKIQWVQINRKWIDLRENKTKELIDTSKPGMHKVQIAVANASSSTAPWTYSNEVTVTVKEEPFTIKQVPYFDFEDHILVSTNKSVVNKKENPTIDLETPSIMGKDWQLQVELSPFLDKENSKSILKGVSLFIPKGKLESDLETEEPTQYDCQLEANGKASILMHGTKTKGKGRWKNKLATKGITLSIPPENKTGNYESTLHWTLLDVPG